MEWMRQQAGNNKEGSVKPVEKSGKEKKQRS
jgi:hypothetical protein